MCGWYGQGKDILSHYKICAKPQNNLGQLAPPSLALLDCFLPRIALMLIILIRANSWLKNIASPRHQWGDFGLMVSFVFLKFVLPFCTKLLVV
jgi:hypothetical protein